MERLLPASGFLSSLTEDQRQTLASYGAFLEYGPQTSVLEIGQKQEYLYVLIRGKVEVSIPRKTGSAMSLTLEALTILGEIGVFCTHTSTASVKTIEPSYIWIIGANKLGRLDTEHPGVAAAFYKSMLPLMIDRYFPF